MDTFTTKTQIIVSLEFKEIVSIATRGSVIPEVDTAAEIVNIHTQESGQTLFMVKFTAEDDMSDQVQDTFPATVAQVQKMHKLWKKANADAPKDVTVKAAVVKAEPEEVIDAANDDF